MSEAPAAKKTNLYPLVLLAAAFAIGILLDAAFRLDPRILIAGILSSSVLAVLYKDKTAGTVLIATAFVLLGSWCSYAERASVGEDRIRTLIDAGVMPSRVPVVVEGTLITPSEPTSEGSTSTLSVQQVTYLRQTFAASGRVRLYLLEPDDAARSEYAQLDLRYGSHVSIACEIEREEQYQNPGVASRVQLMDRQSIDGVATIKSPLVIENIGDDTVFVPLAWVYDVRQMVLEQFHDRFSTATAGVLAASMLGDKYFLDKPTADIFREGGTFHVLVISGLHITFIGGLLLLAVSAFTKNKLLRFAIVSASLWAYALAVGGEAPVVRACLMFTILLFSTVVNRQGSLLNSLGACVIVLLVWRPSDLFNPSLQLTLLSVIAIVGMAFPLIEKLRAAGAWIPSTSTPFPPNIPTWLLRFCEMLYWKPAAWQIESSRQIWSARITKSPYLPALVTQGGQKMVAYIIEGLLVSLIAQMWMLPLLIVYFHRITPVSIVMNLWVGMVIALESFSALLAILIGSFSEFLAAPFFSLTEFLNYLLSSATAGFVQGNWSSWRVPNYSGAWGCLYVLYFVPLTALMLLVWKWDPFEFSISRSEIAIAGKKLSASTLGPFLAALSISFAGVLVFHPLSAPRTDGRLHIDFLDVGQGDSALVTFPDGTTMVIDGGGRMEFRKSDDDVETFVPDTPGIGEAVVSPVLWNKGYSRVDYILATHADADHIQGLTDVAANFDVGEALFGREPLANPEFLALRSVLDRRHIPAELVSRGQRKNFGGAAVEILYPLLDTSPDAVSDNNHSVVVRIVYGGRAFLLTGDIESEAEHALFSGGGDLRADVIKVPHHGSRTSSTPEFIQNVAPEYAIISVGRRSRFGHPHKEVVERWLNSGAKVMTTGQHGMISVSTDGKDLNVQSYLDNRNIE